MIREDAKGLTLRQCTIMEVVLATIKVRWQCLRICTQNPLCTLQDRYPRCVSVELCHHGQLHTDTFLRQFRLSIPYHLLITSIPLCLSTCLLCQSLENMCDTCVVTCFQRRHVLSPNPVKQMPQGIWGQQNFFLCVLCLLKWFLKDQSSPLA